MPTRATKPEADSGKRLVHVIRAALRRSAGVHLFRDPAEPEGGRWAWRDLGWVDVVGTQVGHNERGEPIPRPFALLVLDGGPIDRLREIWLERLRRLGWVTAMVRDADEAQEALGLVGVERARGA